jgi:hypothetical protein
MNTYNTVLYSGNYDIPGYISPDIGLNEFKSNNISKVDINVTIQNCQFFIIEDLLSFPYEWIKSSSINPILIINACNLNEQTVNEYNRFINFFITPYDYIITDKSLRLYPELEESINNTSAKTIPFHDASKLINHLLSGKYSSEIESHILQYKHLSLFENKIAHLLHEKVMLNVFQHVLEEGESKRSCIEFSHNTRGLYKKILSKEQCNSVFYQVKDSVTPKISFNCIDQLHNIGILAFQYHEVGRTTYQSLINSITSCLISGGYLILLEDFIIPKANQKGLALQDWQNIITENSLGQLSVQHFETFQYNSFCNQTTSACFVLRKLGNN